MTAQLLDAFTLESAFSPAAHSAQAPDAQDGTWLAREDEWRVLGHLLGRRETVGRIAAAVGLGAARAEEACEALCRGGKLAAEDTPNGRLYRVRLRAARDV